MLIAYRPGERAVFLYGFAKNERENIDDDELASFKDIAAGLLKADADHLQSGLQKGALQEVPYNDQDYDQDDQK